jgi:hypothetical protein
MESATITPDIPGRSPAPSRLEALALLEQLLNCSREEKRYVLEQLLRDCLGEQPPQEVGIYKEGSVPYVYILAPEHRIRLFVTPERLAMWAVEDRSKCKPFSEMVARLQRGDEEEIREFLASRNS